MTDDNLGTSPLAEAARATGRRPSFLAMAAEDIPAGALVGLTEAGHLRAVGPTPVAGIPSTDLDSPARMILKQHLDEAQDRRAGASLALADAEQAFYDADQEVAAVEASLADLARLEARPKTLAEAGDGDPHR